MADPIAKLSTTHELMGDWILQNPGRTLREMSVHFKYSPSWLCQVINSDMFKAYMQERLKDVHAHVTADIPTLLKGTATLAIERVTEVLQKTEDADTIIDGFDKVMKAYGFGAAPKVGMLGNVQNQQNNFYLSKDEFAKAQQSLKDAHQSPAPAVPEKVIGGDLLPAT